MLKISQRQYALLLVLTFVLGAIYGCTQQSSASKAVKPAPIIGTNSLGMKLVFLSGGMFRMGDADNPYAEIVPDSKPDSAPVHSVSLTAFWIGQYPVTNAQFDIFKKRPRFPESLANNQPAVGVSWKEADAFCRWLSKKEKRQYRLPTEARWEFAARGGLDQKDYPWGNESVDGRACFNQTTTCPVGTYPPNAFGLYDMVGNGGQWVTDWYDENYYAHSPPINPSGPPPDPVSSKRLRVMRGGLYPYFEFKCGRRDPWPDAVPSISGFRVVMEGKRTAFAPPARGSS